MIRSAEEFKMLRESGQPDDYLRAAHDSATLEVWRDVLTKFPELSFWVAQNKSVPVEILESLALNEDSRVRCMVARKRKLPVSIMERLIEDTDESVRLALVRNPKLPMQLISRLVSDSWVEIGRLARKRFELEGL